MKSDLMLSADDWLIIEKAILILKIFYEVSGDDYVTASKYIVFCKIID